MVSSGAGLAVSLHPQPKFYLPLNFQIVENINTNTQQFRDFIDQLVIRIVAIANLNPDLTKILFAYLLSQKMISENFTNDDLKVALTNLFSTNPILAIVLMPEEIRKEFLDDLQTQKLISEGANIRGKNTGLSFLTQAVLFAVSPVTWLFQAKDAIANIKSDLGAGGGSDIDLSSLNDIFLTDEEKAKKAQQQEETAKQEQEPGFLQKYWWVLLILAIVLIAAIVYYYKA